MNEVDQQLSHELNRRPLIILKLGSNHLNTPCLTDVVNLPGMQIRSIIPRTISFIRIQELNIANNHIQFLPDIHTLIKLNCSNCAMDELPKILPQIEEIDCSGNAIVELPESRYYPKLKKLVCSRNQIFFIPTYESLESLICNNNLIKSINIKTLTYLEAYKNPITTIHDLPSTRHRSPILINGRIEYKQRNSEHLDTEHVRVSWPDKKCYDLILKQRIKSHDVLCEIYHLLFIT